MRLAALAIALSVSCPAQTPPKPYTVKSDVLGETLKDWKGNNPQIDHCENNTVDNRAGSEADPDVMFCIPRAGLPDNLTFAAAPLLEETAWFYKGSLYKLEIVLENRFGLPDVMTGLQAKLGDPATRESAPLQNGFGAKFEQEKWGWTNGVSSAELVYSDASNDHPAITFALDEPNKEVDARITRAQQEKARSDI
jgi:hypothetical protein